MSFTGIMDQESEFFYVSKLYWPKISDSVKLMIKFCKLSRYPFEILRLEMSRGSKRPSDAGVGIYKKKIFREKVRKHVFDQDKK